MDRFRGAWRLRALTALAFATGLLVVTGPSAARARQAVLSVRVDGLPIGVPAAITVAGPHHFRRRITRLGVTRIGLPRAGRYLIRVRPVTFENATGGALKGAVAYPVGSTRSVFVRAGRKQSVTASYGTVVNPGLVELPGRIVRVIGDSSHPQALALSGVRRVPRVGEKLSAAPSASLPIGVLAKITSVTGTTSALTVGLQSVPVTDVTPVLRFDLPASVASTARATPREERTDASCNGSGISPYVQLSHFRLSGSIQAVSWTGPHVALQASFDVNTGVNITAAVGFNCSFSINSIPLRAIAPPGIPVYGVLTGHIEVALQAAATLKAGVSIPMSAGGRSIGIPPQLFWTPIFSFGKPQIVHEFKKSATISAGGGISAEIGVGDPNAGNLHLSEDNNLDFTAHPQPCSWDLNLGTFSGGGKLGPFSVSTPSTPPLDHRNLWTDCKPSLPPVYILTISGPIAGGGHIAEAKPQDIKLYSGAYLEHLRWRAWGASTAQATGDELDVDKTTSPYRSLTNPVKVRAYSLRLCGTKRVYRELSVHFTKYVPPGLGLSRDSTYSMSCPD